MRSEKRRHRRVPVGVTMSLATAGPAAGRFKGSIADLSEGGMSLHSDVLLEEGMCLHLKLEGVEIRGEVRHARESSGGQRRYGVHFHKIGFPVPEVHSFVGERA